jgi:hypothetical protein
LPDSRKERWFDGFHGLHLPTTSFLAAQVFKGSTRCTKTISYWRHLPCYGIGFPGDWKSLTFRKSRIDRIHNLFGDVKIAVFTQVHLFHLL